jgi:hypothetical protein
MSPTEQTLHEHETTIGSGKQQMKVTAYYSSDIYGPSIKTVSDECGDRVILGKDARDKITDEICDNPTGVTV